MSDLTAEELEQGRRSLLSQLRQSLRKADLSEYPVDADTMRDLVEVLEGLAPVEEPCRFVADSWCATHSTGAGPVYHDSRDEKP